MSWLSLGVTHHALRIISKKINLVLAMASAPSVSGYGCYTLRACMGQKNKVLITCCNRLLRESISRILSKKSDFEIITGQPLEPLLDETHCPRADVVIIDSLEFLAGQSCAGGNDRLPWRVLVAMEDDPDKFLFAVGHGARGYVLQEASALDVVSAVRAVADGQVACPTKFTRLLFDYVAAQVSDLPDSGKRARWKLTRREQQLLPLIRRGLSNKEIAVHFSLSEQTVKNHLHRIMRKVGVTDRLSIFEACETQSRYQSALVPAKRLVELL
jgi:DNA-binding NarL/FixJ family response regulator